VNESEPPFTPPSNPANSGDQLTPSTTPNDPTLLHILAKFLDIFELILKGTVPQELTKAQQAQIINILMGAGSTATSYIEGPSTLHSEGDLKMSDSYYVGQAAAVGTHATAHDITFSQALSQGSTSIDLSQLEYELAVLRQELKKQANTPEHDIAIAEVANAEIAVKSGDRGKAIGHLRKAGKWVLGVATSIGCGVAASAIKAALGI
jgi:hypothetical protein